MNVCVVFDYGLIKLQPLSELEWNGEQRVYAVVYKVPGTNFKAIVVVPHKDNKVIYKDIDGLQEGLQYQVKVSAFNDVGEGPSSHIITKTAKKPSGKSVATFPYETHFKATIESYFDNLVKCLGLKH